MHGFVRVVDRETEGDRQVEAAIFRQTGMGGHVSLHTAPAADLTTCDWPTIDFQEQEKGFSSFRKHTRTIHCHRKDWERPAITLNLGTTSIMRFILSYIYHSPLCITMNIIVITVTLWNMAEMKTRKESNLVIIGELTSSS